MTNVQKFVIIRHGETEWNKEKKFQGQGDSKLTKLGVLQANLLAETIKKEKFDLFFSSDLQRCIETSRIINKHLEMEIIYDKHLRERNYGRLQGMLKDSIKVKYPEIYSKFNSGIVNFKIPDGENIHDFYLRVNNFFDDIINKNNQKKFLIVTHGGILDCIMRRIMHLSFDINRCFSLFNTSINRFSVANNKWKLETWGDINHLQTDATSMEFLPKSNK